ncbi:hypothetical protein D9M69_426860 [compost metagenome]
MELGGFRLDGFEAKHRVIPALLEGARDQTVGGIAFLIATLGKRDLILGAFDAHMPLAHDGVIALLEFVQGVHGQFEFRWPQGRERCFADRVVEQVAAHAHAIGCRQTLAAARIAQVQRIKATVTLVPHGQRPTTAATDQHPLQQRQPFTRRTAEHGTFAIGSVARQSRLIALEVLRRDIAFVMVGQMDAPVRLGYRLHALMDLSLWRDASAILVTAEDIDARVRGIADQTEHALVSQAPPDESTCPGTAVCALRKAQPIFGKALDDCVCAAGLFK